MARRKKLRQQTRGRLATRRNTLVHGPYVKSKSGKQIGYRTSQKHVRQASIFD